MQILTLPRVYSTLQKSISRSGAASLLAETHYHDLLNGSGPILDFGCGPGTLLATYPTIDPKRFVGVDANPHYVEEARAAFPLATFLGSSHELTDLPFPSGHFEFAVMSGVLHHLPDASARQVLTAISELLAPGGQLLTFDPTWRSHPVALALMVADRGRHIRSSDQYKALIEHAFGAGSCTTREERRLLRVPYESCLARATATWQGSGDG